METKHTVLDSINQSGLCSTFERATWSQGHQDKNTFFDMLRSQYAFYFKTALNTFQVLQKSTTPFGDHFVKLLTPAQKEVLDKNEVYKIETQRLHGNSGVQAQLDKYRKTIKSVRETKRRLNRKWTSYDNPLVDEFKDQQ